MPIAKELFEFLVDLAAHNDRAWFKAHRWRYDRHVKEPLLQLIRDFEGPLHRISPHYHAVPKVGGSLFRIYRDTRFSKDKSPYKTHAGVHFRHAAGRGAHAPGFYLHLESQSCFAAAGIWGPDTRTLTAIRRAIVDDPPRWRAIRDALGGPMHLSTDDERLKRMPRGFSKDLPCAADLRRKHFIASRPLSEEEVLDAHLPEILEASFRQGAPLMQFITGALGLPW